MLWKTGLTLGWSEGLIDSKSESSGISSLLMCYCTWLSPLVFKSNYHGLHGTRWWPCCHSIPGRHLIHLRLIVRLHQPWAPTALGVGIRAQAAGQCVSHGVPPLLATVAFTAPLTHSIIFIRSLFPNNDMAGYPVWQPGCTPTVLGNCVGFSCADILPPPPPQPPYQ